MSFLATHIVDVTGGSVNDVDAIIAAATPSGAAMVTAINAALGGTTWQGGGSGTPAWGAIVGTLSSQSDLQTALNGKAATSHTHTLSQISDITVTSDMVWIPKGIRPGLYDDTGTPPVGTIFESVNDGHLYWVHRDGSVHLLCDSGGYGGGSWGSITGTLSDQTDLQAALDAKQPLDAELSALAGLASSANKLPYFTGSGSAALADFTAAGRTLAGAADAAAQRTAIGAQPLDAELTAIAGLASAADTFIYFTGSGTAALGSVTTAARALLDDTTAAAMRTTLGVSIGSNVQAYDPDLQAIAGLTSAANKLPYYTGSGTAALADFTASGRGIVAAADVAAQRTHLGMVLGVHVQEYSGMLQNIANCPQPFDEIIYYDAVGIATRTGFGAAARSVNSQSTVAGMVDTLGGSASTGTGGLVRTTSPALAGTPTAPTAAAGTNTTQIASTAFATTNLRNAMTPGLRSSRYYGSYAAPATTTFTITANRLYFFPFYCPDQATWTRIGINVTAAVAGNVRLGIYANSSGIPSGAPLLDAGTASVSTTGEKEITISYAMAPGWYWLAMVSDAAPTLTAENISGATLICNVGSLTGAGSNIVHIQQNHTYAALPTPSGISAASTTTPLRIWLRL